MPWVNRSERLLSTTSGPLLCDYEISRETVSVHPVKDFSRARRGEKKAAHVAFSDRIDVREVPPDGSLSLSAGSSMWWTREDYSRMLLNAKHIIFSKIPEDRQPISERSSQVCTLGLETFIGSEGQKRRERKTLVTNAVLKAQEHHKLEGIKDPVYIAELSRSFTRGSVQEAYLRANGGNEIQIPRTEDSFDDHDFVEIRI